MAGKGNLTLTGQLGDVMKESATAALTFVRSHAEEFGIETEVFSQQEFNQIGHGGQEQFGAFSYKPGFAINPLKFLLGLANKANENGVKIYQKSNK